MSDSVGSKLPWEALTSVAGGPTHTGSAHAAPTKDTRPVGCWTESHEPSPWVLTTWEGPRQGHDEVTQVIGVANKAPPSRNKKVFSRWRVNGF